MAAPRLVLLSVLVLVLGAITFSEGIRMASGPKKCCFVFSVRPLPRDKVLSYTRTSQQCSNPGVMFKTRKGRVCAKPSDIWVKEYISFLDSRKPGENSIM